MVRLGRSIPPDQGNAAKESVIVRNLLGRLHARPTDDLGRIAAWWSIPLTGADRSRHVGVLYRSMTDLRTARDAWQRLDDDARAIVRDLAIAESGALTVADIARLTATSEPVARSACVRLFEAGILAREGDNQELPVGAVPRLLLPRELGQVFRRVQDELDAGDLSQSSLRVLVETLDDPEIEEAGRIWGINVIPGMRRRADLVDELLGQMSSPDRIERVVRERGRHASALYAALRDAGGDPMALDDALGSAGLAVPPPSSGDHIRAVIRTRDTLTALEAALLVCHTYRRDGSRWLFIPREILNPHEVVATLPLRPLQPLAADTVSAGTPDPAYALAWDVLTVLREITEHDAPIWVPGEPLARSWQRRINRRLWRSGEDVPPVGYSGFLFQLASSAGLVVPATGTVPGGLERGGLRPAVSPSVREWRRLEFAGQTARLHSVWLASDVWIESRERQAIDVWGADWPGFRTRLLAALGELESTAWYRQEDLAARLAEQDPGLIGPTFTAASSRSGGGDRDQRTVAIAQVIELELETALSWFGIVERGTTADRAPAVRLSAGAAPVEPGDEPVLSIDDAGLITLHRPSPLHVWSLSAFADSEGVRPAARYQLRPGSVSRALGAGFDLEQITAYLERQAGNPLPEKLAALLREWTVGYRRVRVRRAVVLRPDTPEMRDALRGALRAEGYVVADTVSEEGADPSLVVMLDRLAFTADGGNGGGNPEQDLLASLRAHGYAGHIDGRAASAPSRPGRDSA